MCVGYEHIAGLRVLFWPLDVIISRLLSLSQKKDCAPPLTRQAFRYLYLVSKVRGPKVVLRWFSHEVADLEPVLSQLESQNITEHEVG